MTTPKQKTAKPKKMCERCGVNEVEYITDDECAWCREKRHEAEGA